jgi:hypothetical protein
MSEKESETESKTIRMGVYFDAEGLKLWDSIKSGDKSKNFSRMAILGNHLRANEVSKRTLLAGLASGFFQQLGIITNPNSSPQAVSAAKKALFAGIDNSWGTPVLGEIVAAVSLSVEKENVVSPPEVLAPKKIIRPSMPIGGLDLSLEI